MRRSPSATSTVEGRLLAFESRVRPRLWVAVAFGALAAVCVLAMAVAAGGGGIAGLHRRCVAGHGAAPAWCGVALARASSGLPASLQEVLAQRPPAVFGVPSASALTGHLLALGPVRISGERSGELVTAMTGGLDDIDAVHRELPAGAPACDDRATPGHRRGAAARPANGAGAGADRARCWCCCWSVIGGRTRVISGRRAIELRWLGAFFLDMLQGLATLRMFGRSREQIETIRAVSQQYGETTMDVLRTAFQTALVLEWGAAVATAVVAVEVSLRLMNGQIPFERALAVLIITPEFFLPLRQLAIRYHSGSAGRAAAERVFQILDTPLQQGSVTAGRPARPTTPTSAARCPARRHPLRGRLVQLRRSGAGAARSRPCHPGRERGGTGGSHRSRQDDLLLALAAVHRAWNRPHHGRRRGPRRHRSLRLAVGSGLGATAAAPLPRQRGRQHPACAPRVQ